MSNPARAWLLVAIALAACIGLSGRLPAAAAAAASVPGPWETAGPYPSRFDLRTEGRVTPVRSQDAHSTCWIMAATGSLESAAVTAEGRTLDFSENNLANHMASRLDFEGRAPSELAVAYYARWEGPVWDASDPYPRPGRSPHYLRAVRHVQEVLFLPRRRGPLDNDAVKWAVTTYGGVDAAAYFHTQAEYHSWNSSTNSYYSDTAGELNHHILCVGWDDSYSAANFLPEKRPPGDGAFLIKNSWGTDFADNGYLWVSYYDASFGKALAVFNGVVPSDDFDAIYQYDALGRSAWIGTGGEQAWYASRFRCVGSGKVAAVSFYTPVPGTAYEVRVAGSVRGVAAAPVAASGTVPVGGYHTIRLDSPAPVARGDVFVAAVRVTTPGWSLPVPVERPSSLISPRAKAGQSYLSADGTTWTDLTSRQGLRRANVCLKAFVDATGAGDTRAPRVKVVGGVVRRGRPVHVRWELTDRGFSSASAIIVLAVRNARGRVVLRRRIPAVAVGESGSWRVVAPGRGGSTRCAVALGTWPAGARSPPAVPSSWSAASRRPGRGRAGAEGRGPGAARPGIR